MYNVKNKYIDKSANCDKADFRDLDFSGETESVVKDYSEDKMVIFFKKNKCYWHDSCIQ
jgi:hypothetical protein